MIFSETWSIPVSAPTMLAAVATLGYLIGRRRSKAGTNRADSRHEIIRALAVARELESVTERLQQSLTAHLPAVSKFSSRLQRMERSPDLSWHDLCDRADELLKPVLRLSTEISHSYAEILQQMTHLTTFAELRTDPLTGAANRRAFDDSLSNLLAKQSRHPGQFSLAILDIDFFKRVNDEHGHLQGDRVLHDLAELLKDSLREVDIVARYGGEEFVLLMPHTELASACNLCERIRARIQTEMPITVSMGLAGSLPEDSASSLLARADAALYVAKGAGRNCVQVHEGPPGRIVGIRVTSSPVAPLANVGQARSAGGKKPAIAPQDSESFEPAVLHSEAC
jgi:diguanylate cyclase (GGDEF)-like protein